jgi:glyoxylase-like metal-dependent hydrolase (beta-lactamase superfamily II)
MNKLRIRAINTGSQKNIAKSAICYKDDSGERIDIAIPMFLIEGGEQKILVDTGICDPETTLKYHGHILERKPDEDPVVGLRKAGVAPEDISIVINTHLHYDHCSNNYLFTNAKFFVQRKELAYAICPDPTLNVVYETGFAGFTPPWFKNLQNIVAVEGEFEVIPGVRLIPLPGHSPGLQGVLVDTEKGKYLLASDMVYLYESWRGNKTFPHIPAGQLLNLDECMASFAYMEKIADVVLPSHDPEIVKQGFYPE